MVIDTCFNVVIFYQDESYEYAQRDVGPERAVEAAKNYASSVGARMGIVARVIITDMLDNTCFEWKYGEGVVFPPRENQNETENS